MDKEAREAIENDIHEWLFGAKIVDSLALRILSLLKELGYLKVPELKVIEGNPYPDKRGFIAQREAYNTGKAEQLDSILKQIEEANQNY